MGHAFEAHYRRFGGRARARIPVFPQPFSVYPRQKPNEEGAAMGELDEYPHAEYAFRVGDDIIKTTSSTRGTHLKSTSKP
jgi:hypothetical protein